MQKLLLTTLLLSFFCALGLRANTSPNIQCPANMTVTVTDINCRAAVDLPSVYLQSNCSYITSVEAIWLDAGVGKTQLASLEFEMDSTGTDTLAVFGSVADFPIGTTTIVYVVTDDCGDSSECSFELTVMGSTLPSCTAPADINVSCTTFDPSLASYGQPIVEGCSVDSIQVFSDWIEFDQSCMRGTIVRQFTVLDYAGRTSTCTQEIVADYEQEYYIRFPDDVFITGICDTSGIYGQPTFFGTDCKLINPFFEDQKFTVVPDACFKIERTWKIINWCTYNPNLPIIKVPNPSPNAQTNHADNFMGPIVSPIQILGDPWKSTQVKIHATDTVATNYSIYYDPGSSGYEYKQIIKVIDMQFPYITKFNDLAKDSTSNDSLLWNAPYWYNDYVQSADLCEVNCDFAITASDACSGSEITFDFFLSLDLDGDWTPETMISSAQLPPANTVIYNNIYGVGESRQFDFRPVPDDQKWKFALETVVSGKFKTAYVRFNTTADPNSFLPAQLPHGKHRIQWIIRDQCGPKVSWVKDFTAKDAMAPTVTCLPDQSMYLTISGYKEVHISDILGSAEDNCTPNSKLLYGMRRAGMGPGFPYDPNYNAVTSVWFDCFDVGPQLVELWCRDLAGNASFCTATITFLEPSGVCEEIGTVSLSGDVKTEIDEGIANVAINLNGTVNFVPPFSLASLTDTVGRYVFHNSIPFDASIVLEPVLDNNPLNGVTTYDLVLISKHILGLSPLSSPYKLIAADANKSGSITTFDIVEIRKLILGITQELPNNNSWRFVRKSYAFPNPLNPFLPAFPENSSFQHVLSNQVDIDFIGIKIGDVNNTAVGNASSPADKRSAGTQNLTVDSGRWTVDGRVEPGEEIDITFSSEQVLEGCQFTLNTYGLEVLEIVPGDNMEREHFALFPEKNALTMAWEKAGTASFTLKCKATEAGNLREMLRIGSRITKAEAYQENGQGMVERFDVALRFPSQSSFELFQNRPNPFAGATEISFNLPEASAATLKIYDVHGRVLYTQTGDYAQGMNTVSLEKSALDRSGILYYQIETEGYRSTRKMMKM